MIYKMVSIPTANLAEKIYNSVSFRRHPRQTHHLALIHLYQTALVIFYLIFTAEAYFSEYIIAHTRATTLTKCIVDMRMKRNLSNFSYKRLIPPAKILTELQILGYNVKLLSNRIDNILSHLVVQWCRFWEGGGNKVTFSSTAHLQTGFLKLLSADA